MLFLFVPQESWDLQFLMFGYITCGFPRIFGYVLQVIKYSISVPLDRGGFGGWNLMLTKNVLHRCRAFEFKSVERWCNTHKTYHSTQSTSPPPPHPGEMEAREPPPFHFWRGRVRLQVDYTCQASKLSWCIQ